MTYEHEEPPARPPGRLRRALRLAAEFSPQLTALGVILVAALVALDLGTRRALQDEHARVLSEQRELARRVDDLAARVAELESRPKITVDGARVEVRR